MSHPPPILVFEMTWTGNKHAPGNGATLQTIAAAFPDSAIHVFAEILHLRELSRAGLPAHRMTAHPIRVSRHFAERTSIFSVRRVAREFATLAWGFRLAGWRRPCLVVLLSATGTAMFAVRWLGWLRGGVSVQIGLHGNLNEIYDLRSRNLVARSMDLQSAMLAHAGHVRFLVLEDSILTRLACSHPWAAGRMDVLPLPINPQEGDLGAGASPAFPDVPGSASRRPSAALHFGFVGLATQAKGIDAFLSLARTTRSAHGAAVVFHLVGHLPPGTDAAAFAVVAEPVSMRSLTRAAFTDRLAGLHYVVLPFRPGYYDLAASGALIDAITWCKPLIVIRTGFVDALFAQAGDVGHLCETDDEMRAVVQSLLTAPDEARYRRQVAALAAARAARAPSVLAATYRAIVSAHFPAFAAG